MIVALYNHAGNLKWQHCIKLRHRFLLNLLQLQVGRR